MTSEQRVVLVLIPDLFFLSRVRSVAATEGARLDMARATDDLMTQARAHPPRLIVLDMRGDPTWPAAVRSLKADPLTASVPVIVFGPHVDEASQAEARAAGADRVLSNQRFTATLPRLFGQYLNQQVVEEQALDKPDTDPSGARHTGG